MGMMFFYLNFMEKSKKCKSLVNYLDFNRGNYSYGKP